MTDAKLPQASTPPKLEPSDTEVARLEPSDTEVAKISPETRSLVEQRLPDESDEIKHHMMALIDAIKRRAETEINSAGDITRDAYVVAMRQAQETLEKAGDFFNEQQSSLESSISGVEDSATQRWETMLADMQEMGNRLDRAVNAAWKILTEPDSEKTDTEAESESTPSP